MMHLGLSIMLYTYWTPLGEGGKGSGPREKMGRVRPGRRWEGEGAAMKILVTQEKNWCPTTIEILATSLGLSHHSRIISCRFA